MAVRYKIVRSAGNIPLTHSFKLFKLDDHRENSSMTSGPVQAAYTVFVPTKSAMMLKKCIVAPNQISKHQMNALQSPSAEAATKREAVRCVSCREYEELQQRIV
jgi:hypothetical protein